MLTKRLSSVPASEKRGPPSKPGEVNELSFSIKSKPRKNNRSVIDEDKANSVIRRHLSR
jgi:hypothetical protein